VTKYLKYNKGFEYLNKKNATRIVETQEFEFLNNKNVTRNAETNVGKKVCQQNMRELDRSTIVLDNRMMFACVQGKYGNPIPPRAHLQRPCLCKAAATGHGQGGPPRGTSPLLDRTGIESRGPVRKGTPATRLRLRGTGHC
jgi:hypothetical protein